MDNLKLTGIKIRTVNVPLKKPIIAHIGTFEYWPYICLDLLTNSNIVGKSSKFGKAVAIVQAIQDTFAGANKALSQGGLFGFVGAASVIATGIRNVKQIASTKSPEPPAGLKAGSSASVPTPNVPSITTPNIPEFDILGTSGTNQIASALGEQPPVQAFVVAQDVTTSQSLQNNIIQGASLG